MAYHNNLKVLSVNDVNLDYYCIKEIIDKCSELTDLGISSAILSNTSIEYICKNLTSNTLRLDISSNEVKDEHIQSLVERCKNLEHIDLSETLVTFKSVTAIVTALSHSLVSLSLPQNVGLEIGLPNDVSMDKLKIIFNLTKLENLHITCFWYDSDGVVGMSDHEMEALGVLVIRNHFEKLAKIFPKLTIGRDRGSSGYKIMKTDPCYHFYEPKFKEVTCFPSQVKSYK